MKGGGNIFLTCLLTRNLKECARQRQARYEARQRSGVALYPAPLSAVEIDALIALGWLREGTEGDRGHVGEAVAAAIREIARARR